MDRRGVFLIVFLVLAVVAVYAVAVPMAVDKDTVPLEDVESFDLGFEMDGGTCDGLPASYISGTYMDLPVPEREGMSFAGWYLDSGLQDPRPAVLPQDRGPMTFHAKWSQESIVGTVLTYSERTSYDMGDRIDTSEGERVLTYVTEKDGDLYVEYTYDVRFSDGTHLDGADGYWSDGIPAGRYVGNEYVGDVLCMVYSDGDTREYYPEWGIMLRSVSSEYPRSEVELVSRDRTVPDDGIDLFLWVQYGIAVTGDMPERIGDSFRLVAEGDRFKYWTVNGSIVDDNVLTVERADPYTTYMAVSDARYTVLEDRTVDMASLGYGGQNRIYDSGFRLLHEDAGTIDLEPGLYYFVRPADGCFEYRPYFVEEVRHLEFGWDYGGHHSLGFDARYSDVYSDTYYDVTQFRHYMPEHASRFLDPDCAGVRMVSDMLLQQRGGMDDRQFAEFVLRFVQEIPFKYDTDTFGEEDHWQYPYETLWNGGGDCEDKSILYASLMNCMGYRTCILIFPTHAMAGIVLEDQRETDDTFVYDDVTYTYAEASNTNLGFWTVSDRYPYESMVGIHFP